MEIPDDIGKEIDFWNRIIHCEKLQFCMAISKNASLTNICDLMNGMDHHNSSKIINENQCYCIYLKCKENSNDLSQILLQSLDRTDKKKEIKIDKTKQKIDSNVIAEYLMNCDYNKRLSLILNGFYNKLLERDEDKLILFQAILNNADSELLIDAATLCQILIVNN